MIGALYQTTGERNFPLVSVFLGSSVFL